jgi:glycosyltransferase 2 family protein
MRLLRICYLSVLTIVIVVLVHLNWDDVRASMANVSGLLLFGACCAALLGLLAALYAWRAVLSDLGSTLPVRDAAAVFFPGQLGKYLPGSVWPALRQADLARRYGSPPARTVSATLVSIAIAWVAGLCVGAISSPFLAIRGTGYVLFALMFVPVALVLLHPAVINRFVGWVFRAVRRPGQAPKISSGGVRVSVVWFVVQWMFNGAHLWFLVVGVGGSPRSTLGVSVSAFALASIVGVVVTIAPAGAGVREALLVVFLSSVLSRDQAAAAAVASRLVLLLADLVAAGVAVTLAGARSPRRSSAVGG